MSHVARLCVFMSLLALGLVALLAPSPAAAQSFVVDQQNVRSNNSGWSFRFLSPIGQSFTPSHTSLNAVWLVVGNTDTRLPFPATLVVRIRQMTIDGPILGTSTPVLVPFGTDGTVTQFDFPTPVPLTPGLLHVIEVAQVGGDGNGFISGSYGYSGGHAIIHGLVATFEDLWFQEGITSSAVGSDSSDTSTCAQNLAIGNFTLCGEAFNNISSTSIGVNYSPTAGNAIIAYATWCFVSSCDSSVSGVTATIGDNINATESCFVASPHSPFVTNANGGAQGSGDFQQHYVWYCPSIPSGVTSFTVTPTGLPSNVPMILNISEWKAGSLAASCSPISACFEDVDNVGQAGNSTGGTIATITTSGPTVNANDLIFASTETPCCLFTASAGTGYTGITVAPSVNPSFVSEAKAVTATGIQTATSTVTGGSTPWFGVIVPIKGVGPAPVAPTVGTVSPNNGPVAGGTAVTIAGANFVTGATVTFGSAAATSVLVVNSTTITATAPAGTAGTVTVTVTNPGGLSGSLVNGFTYAVMPTVSGVSPKNGSTSGGTAVKITGTNFVTGATVTFGSAAATNVVVVSSTSIKATTPAGAGTVTVTVTNPNGLSGTLTNGFTYKGRRP